MELKEYIRIVKHWAWLLILGLVLGGGGGYLASSYQVPVYQASTRVMVMRPPQESASDYTYLSAQQLTQTYVQLVTTQPVLDAASAELGYEVEREQISVQQIRDTQVIQLTVEDENPEHAAAIANVLVDKLIEQNDAFQAGRFNSAEASLREQIQQVETQISGLQTIISQISNQNLKEQIEQLEAQITPLQEEVLKLEQEIAALPTHITQNKVLIAEKQARINQIKPLLNVYQEIYSNLLVFGQPIQSGSGNDNDPQLSQLQSTLSLYQQIYINLLNSLETIRLARLQNTPNIVQIEPASTPEMPIRPRTAMNTALAAVVGLMLAAGIVFLVEHLDDTLKTPDEVERVLGVPVLGFIADMQYRGKGFEVYVTRQPRSPVSEAFRSLRTNLEYASVQKPIHTLIVTSPEPSEGKTTIAVNLAAIYSQAKRKVALLDADMRHPNVHRYMGLTNQDGLTNLFRDQTDVLKIARNKVDLPKLSIITTGNLPPNPAELLGSDRMGWILEELRSIAEMVIIDTPPSLVADAQVLAAKVDAVLLVIKPGKTSAASALSSMELYRRAGVRVVGVVLNRIPRNRSYYYGGYKYYSPYSESKGYFSGINAELEEIPSADLSSD
ncbi:polysaccharide biosynthesis tyrosine autokinase [Chloroflexi bacterium CFX6]|nr:polysaccharide biosynthesis tyrosine autokinase [Chloroflexi bacterium CFX6]